MEETNEKLDIANITDSEVTKRNKRSEIMNMVLVQDETSSYIDDDPESFILSLTKKEQSVARSEADIQKCIFHNIKIIVKIQAAEKLEGELMNYSNNEGPGVFFVYLPLKKQIKQRLNKIIEHMSRESKEEYKDPTEDFHENISKIYEDIRNRDFKYTKAAMITNLTGKIDVKNKQPSLTNIKGNEIISETHKIDTELQIQSTLQGTGTINQTANQAKLTVLKPKKKKIIIPLKDLIEQNYSISYILYFFF